MTEPLKILMVEDTATDAELIQRLLKKEKLHCEFNHVMNKEAFQQALGEYQPDIILADNSLPQFSATEALEILKERSLHIPFILVTGTVSEEFAAGIIKLGANDYILKDRLIRLPAAIDAALKQQKAEKEKKDALENLIQSEEKYRALIERVSDAFIALDKNWRYTYLNKQAGELIHRDPEFLIGKNIWDEFPDIVGSATYKSFKKAMDEQRYISNTDYYQPFDLWMENHIYPSQDGVSVFIRNITEKKQAEDELKKLSMVAKETINGVIITDNKHKVIWINNAFTKMCGYNLDEIKGKDPMEFLHRPGTDTEVVNYVKKQFLKKVPFAFDELAYTKEGDKIYMRVQLQPIFDENGDIKQYFSLQTDITKQRELEEKVELEKIIKQKEITDAVYAAQENERSAIGREMHDNVNQLLGATRLYIDMAKKSEENRDSLLTDASNFTLTAIEEIRKLSKTLITPLINEVGLVDSIKDLAEEIRLVHPIQITITANDFIEAGLNDKFKLNIFRIVQEQINNILKHAQAKKIDIRIEDNFGKLLISVTDDGIGFDTAKRKTGIGITNIKSRSGLYNGRVIINSAEGEGTILSLTFDRKDLLNSGA